MESSEQTCSSSSNLQVSTKKTPSVIVIGAGFGGLSAARALHDASFHVTLLESRDRYGGRVWTNNSLGFPVDMGASWLHGFCDENPLAPLIKRLEVPLHRTSGDDSVLYDHDLESYALYDVDGTKVDQELVTKVGKIFDVILEETTEIRKKLSEDISIEKAISIVLEEQPHLRQEGVAHKVLQWYICRMEGWFATDASNISLKYWDEEDLLSGGHYLMVGGYRSVLDELAVGLDIRLSHRVTKIDQRRNNEVKVTVEDGQTFVADAAIVAVPLGVLRSKSVSFEPRLPVSKETAIADLGVGIENKIALHFNEVFWPNVEFLGIVASSSYGCSYFLNLHKATGHKVLVYMPAGQLALDMDKLSEKDAANEAYIHLKNILPGASEPVGYLVSHWGTDINSLGSYSYDSVGKSHELYEQLRKPVNNIFFAGEATSQNYPGTVHGAFSTGLLAAKECIKKCGNLD